MGSGSNNNDTAPPALVGRLGPVPAAGVTPPPPAPLISSGIGKGDIHRPDTSELDNYDGAKDAFNVPVEGNFGQFSFETAYSCMVGADPTDVAPGIPQGYAEASVNIGAAMDAFKGGLASFNASPDTWKGDTHNAALTNLQDSYPILVNLTKTMAALRAAAQSFSATIVTTRNDIVSRSPSYLADLQNHPEQADQIKQQYNAYAQAVMTQVYAPNIQKIVSVLNNLPAPDAGSSSQAGGVNGFGGGSGLGGGAGAGRAFGGAAGGAGRAAGIGALPPIGNPGTPTMPNVAADTNLPSAAQAQNALQAATDPYAGMSSGLQGLSGLTSPLQSALSQAMQAGRQGGNPGVPGAGGLGKLPGEGALRGLGPKGSGGGAGGGAKGPLPSMAKAAGAPATAAGSAAGRTVATGMRAGLPTAAGSAAAGAPGAGAPAGGHHGGAAPGGSHQPNKVLRSKKNGEQLIGAPEAVVAVLGESARPDTPKPDAT